MNLAGCGRDVGYPRLPFGSDAARFTRQNGNVVACGLRPSEEVVEASENSRAQGSRVEREHAELGVRTFCDCRGVSRPLSCWGVGGFRPLGLCLHPVQWSVW